MVLFNHISQECSGFGYTAADQEGLRIQNHRDRRKSPAKVIAGLIEGFQRKLKDAIDENDVVLLHDDLLATGGTMAATHRLVQRCGAKKIFINFIIELGGLNGRKAFPEDITVDTLLTL